MRDIGPQPSRFYLARHWQTRIRYTAVSGIWDNGNRRSPGIGRNLIADVSDDVRCDSEVGNDGTSYCPAKLRYLERLLANANTTWAMVQRRWPAAPVCPL